MLDKFSKTFLLIVIGWFIGYMHHFYATRPLYEQLYQKISDLQTTIVILDQNIGEIADNIAVLNKKFKVKSKFRITGYSNDPKSINVSRWRDGKTATGLPVEPGICAADWSVLPIGSLVWVDGYGWCEVQDRGGKVKGRHIDLFFPSPMEALKWGSRTMDVVISREEVQ